MIDYQTFQQIRLLHDQQKLNAAQIARSLGLHWQTVQKWIGRPRYEARAAAPPHATRARAAHRRKGRSRNAVTWSCR